jgi:hypothetical protein
MSCNHGPYEISGQVISAISKKPLKNAEILLTNKTSNRIYSNTSTDSIGFFSLPIISKKMLDSAILFSTKDGYVDTSLKIEWKSNLIIALRPVQLRFSEEISNQISTQQRSEIRILNFYMPSGIDEYLLKRVNDKIVRIEYSHKWRHFEPGHSFQFDNRIS